jgi:DNA-binding NarL/FixJ family response regulator
MVRVLIVDDCAVVRDGLSSLLRTAPAIKVVGEASSGEAALGVVERLLPHVVLVDAQMPDLDGVETTRRIKARWPSVKVLFLTVHTSYIEDARAAGADGHLMKDCTAHGLVSAIMEVAGGDLRRCA